MDNFTLPHSPEDNTILNHVYNFGGKILSEQRQNWNNNIKTNVKETDFQRMD
jgi:hypothetical protein